MYKRPQRGESDEDLLKLQEDFIKNKVKPAAQLANIRDEKKHTPIEEKASDLPKQISNTFEVIPSNVSIGGIVEKLESNGKNKPFMLYQNKGFPLAKRRDSSIKPTKGSIFSQQIKRLKRDEAMDTGNSAIKGKPSTSNVKKNLPSASYLLSGSSKHEIHEENIDIMSKMTEEEIVEEREKLMSTMDPAIVAFLKSRRFHASKLNDDSEADMEKQNKAGEQMKAKDIKTVTEILTEPKAERWLHFDKLETNKLAWMKDIDLSRTKGKEAYEARFDFGGWLLPYIETEMNEKNRVLYHHGEEPDRPGYTLQELFQLCRSNIIQQKITALNSVANILSLETSGIYDNTIDVPIEQVFFVLRFCLDDNTPSVLNASIKALRNMFYYAIDEACADGLLGFGLGMLQPSLSSEEQDEEDDETVNDQQLAETNLVKCLVRTQILNRIRYVINTIKPPIETVTYCIELLIRLARDSLRTINLIYKCENLVASIISHFVPKVIRGKVASENYGLPLKQAIKFLRILATRSKQIALELVDKYNIMDSVLLYLSNEQFSTNTSGIQLQTESLHFWTVLISYDLSLNYFVVVQPALLRMLHFHINNTNLDMSTTYTIQGHVAAILNIIGQVATRKFEYILPYVNILNEQALVKWTAQFNSLNSYLCGKLLIIASLLHCSTCIVKYKPAGVDGEFKSVNAAVQNLINSKGFKVVTSNIKSGSNILSKHQTHKPCKNLLSMEAAVWGAYEHITPILQTNSCLPFLAILSEFIEVCDDYQLKLSFLQHENLQTYLALIKDTKNYNLTSNWFTRVESALIMNVLKISTVVQRDVDTSLYYEVAVKCLSIFNSKQKPDIQFLLGKVIFNKNYYPSEILMRNLNISERNEALATCLRNLEHIFETYMEVLGLSVVNPQIYATSLCLDVKIGNVIPIDWIYSPIVALYSSRRQSEDSSHEAKLIFIVTNCLRWIYIYETYFSGLASLINPVDKFCRLACVFLGSDDLFFVPEIHDLLHRCLRHLLANGGDDLDFNKSVHGLSSFQDFYTQLLEQYQGVSYGNVLFGNFVLVPLMQKQNVQYRKLLWSEYAGVVQICKVTAEELLCPLEMFLSPQETDRSLLSCYKKAVIMRVLPQRSVLGIIANHHVGNCVDRVE